MKSIAPFKVLIADDIDLSSAKTLPQSKFLLTIKPGISNSQIIDTYSSYDILITRSTRKIDKSFLQNSDFKIIATCSKGTDHIDTLYAISKNITILNSENGNTTSAAEHALGLIIAASKNIMHSDSNVRRGKFKDYSYSRSELCGKTIGIIGYGKIGSTLGGYCTALGMNILANDINKSLPRLYPRITFKSINYLLKYSDIVSLHIPLNPGNYNFLNSKKLSLLSQKSILINTSRGEIIDENYLIQLLKDNLIRFAALDVFIHEPQINSAFFSLKNVLLTNHIAGKTQEAAKKMADEIFQKILKLCS